MPKEQLFYLASLDDWNFGMYSSYADSDSGYWVNDKGITFVEPGDKWISLDTLAEFLNTLEEEG
jgi:hypothetical protein